MRFKVCVDGVVKHGDAVKASIGEEGEGQVATLYGFHVMARSGTDPAQSLCVDVTHAQVLRLVVDDAVNGQAQDYADWGDARLITADGSVVYLSDLPDDRQEGLPWDWTVVRLTELPADPAWNLSSGGGIVLAGQMGNRNVPVRFSYLGSLGDNLIQQRPVLHSWIRLASEPTEE